MRQLVTMAAIGALSALGTLPMASARAGETEQFQLIHVDQLVADALPRRERVMLNSLGMKRPGGGSSRLARFAPLRELTPAEESALNDLPKETRLRRRRAHDVASVLGLLHMDGFGR